ncbi:Heptaprenyl diphosphate synthase component 1 [compost metagenome]
MNLDHISNLAQKYVGYDMISKYTELPTFPIPRVHLLYTFLNTHKQDYTPDAAQSCALASFLVQLGLDTHDLIDQNTEKVEDTLMRSRQLKVLAGDYFSSVFYELLAAEGNITTIASMCGAICEVNRLKVNLYSKLKSMRLTAEQYLKDKVSLKMGLFISYTTSLDKSLQNIWKLLLTEFSRCEVLMDEWDQRNILPDQRVGYAYLKMMETGSSEDKEKLLKSDVELEEWQTLLSKYHISDQLIKIFSQSVDQIQVIMKECHVEKIHLQLEELLESLKSNLMLKYRLHVEG